MDNQHIPESIYGSAEKAFRDAIQRAFEAGYTQGQTDAAARMMAAAQGLTGGRTIDFSRAAPETSRKTESGSASHPNAADNRRFPYGAVSKAFRGALTRYGSYGLTRDELIERVSELLGQDVSDMKHRDTLKRMKLSNELRQANGKYYPGSALTGLNENGAAEAAPDAGEAATSPDRPELDLKAYSG